MSYPPRLSAALALFALLFASTAFAQPAKNEVETNFSFSSATFSGINSNRTTEYRWRVTYGRFLTERVAIGPVFAIRNDENNGTRPYNLGGLARVYLGDPDGSPIPFVEITSTRTFDEIFYPDYTDVQVSAGLVFPMGRSGGRFRIAPYYYRAFHDAQQTGFSYLHSFGVSWSVGLLF